MPSINLRKINTRFESFFDNNAGFNILTFNFLDPHLVGTLDFLGADKESVLPSLKAYQRVLRLCPDIRVAHVLMDAGLDSSIKITDVNRSVFVNTYGPKFGADGLATAKKVYDAALHTRDRVMNLVASVKTVSGSAHFKNLLFNNVSDEVSRTFQDLASYQDFFGSLDYCACDECKSIFGAAAYLVDLLRIIDKGITQPNTHIEAGLHFFDRRPDIAKIELTCANTNNLIPYLQIVNNLLASTLENALQQNGQLLGGDIFLTLANTYYPFNLPFNLPLQQIRAVMNNSGGSLSDIASALSPGSPMTADIARKVLGFSVETFNNLESPAPAKLAAVVSANYGLTVSDGNLNGLDVVSTFLGQTGISLTDLTQLLTQNLNAKEIFDVSGAYTPSVFGPALTLRQVVSTVIGTYGTDGTLKGTIDGQKVRGEWSSVSQAPPATKGDFEFDFTPDGSSFTGKWSKGLGLPWETTTWNGTLNGTSTQGIIPHSLFINGTLAARQYLGIVSGKDEDTIAGQSLGTLDRLNRFMRLSWLTGWSYVDLNWILVTLGVGDITDAVFIELAKIKQCTGDFGMDLNLANALWFDIRTIGVGTGAQSAAPFDQVFNSPTIVQQTGKTYHPVIAPSATSFVNPLYTDQAYLLVVDQVLYEKSNPDPVTQQRVAAGQIVIKGISASQNDLLAMARAAFGDVATVELTVSNLSLLYRHLMFARKLNTTVDRYLLLLKLLGLAEATINPILDRDDVLLILNISQRIKTSGFTVYDIDYLCNQLYNSPLSPYVNTGYRLSALPAFLTTLAALLKGMACQPGSFTYNTIPGDDSAQLYGRFTSLGVIDANGLVMEDPATITSATWGVIFVGQLIGKDDFIDSTNSIDQAASELIFSGLATQGILDANGLIVKVLSAINWDTILIGPAPGQKLTADQQKFVLATMNGKQANLAPASQDFVISKLDSVRAAQANLFANQVGAFFSITADVASLAIDAVRDNDDAYLQPFGTAPNPDPSSDSATFILHISKILMLQRIPALSQLQFASVCSTPEAYNLSGDNTYTLSSILEVAGLGTTIQALGDTNNQLLQYFAGVWAAKPPDADTLQAELCGITGWDIAQYVNVSGVVLGNSKGCQTLNDVIVVKAVFDLAVDLGISTYFLQQLNTVTSLAATTSNWPVYTDTAARFLLTLQAAVRSDAVQDQYKKINSIIEERKRDAMLPYSIKILGAIWTDIKTPGNLYEFLLIDPENGGCADVSLIEEAMNAAQLYLQRCRLNLEKNVRISTDDIPDVWWEWMMTYRIWEANREIFLYPENYIDPSLRKSRTTIFQNLENTLMQGQVTADLVETAYIKYLDDFSAFAKLRYVDAYQTIVADKERGDIDTLFLFSRTYDQPYQFYYISRETVGGCQDNSQYLWSEWKSVNIKIDARHVTPIYAFNKLFVFWVELTSTKESGGLTGATGSDTSITTRSNIITKATIKYSYYNFLETWVQPQVLVSDQVVNVETPGNNIYGSFYKQFTDTEASCWDRVSVIKVDPGNYVGGQKSLDEKLVVYFGPLANSETLGSIPLTPDDVTDSPSLYAFKEMLQQAYFNLDQMKFYNLSGYIPLCSHYVIDESLTDQIILRQNEFLTLRSNTLSPFAIPTFVSQINHGSLAVVSDYETVASNNSNGIEDTYEGVVKGPQSVDNSSFIIYPYIDDTLSASIFSAIGTNMPEILNGGVITQAALGKTIADITTKLGVTNDQALLVQNRFFELYNGSLVLFSSVAHNAGVVPVKNQPNTFIFDNSDEAFLVTAINNVIEETYPVLNPDSFVSGSVDKPTSEAYFAVLSTAPNNYISPSGTVNAALVAGATKFSLSHLLGSSTDIAQGVLDILTAATQATQSVVKKNYPKLDTQLTVTATLAPTSFVGSGIDETTSETYYVVLSTAPNNYIQPDGSVNIVLAKALTTFSLAPLLGLKPTDPGVTRVYDVLKSAAYLMTADSFITWEIDPTTGKPYIDQPTSAGYFTTLSTFPNNYINPDGSVNTVLLSNATKFSMAHLLNAGDFAVAKVLSVLQTPEPVTMGYVYPNEPGAGVSYEHDNIYSLQFNIERISTGAIAQIGHAMTFGGVEYALKLDMQQPPVTIKKPFSYLGPNTAALAPPLSGPVVIPPILTNNQEVAFDGPYGMYYWELFFHTPFLVAEMLNSNQQFSDAESWLQYIFNPTMQSSYLTKDVFIAERPQDIDANTMESLYPVLSTAPNQYIDPNGRVTSLAPNATPFAMSRLLGITMDQAQEIINLLNNYYVTKPEVRAWQFDPFRNYVLQTMLQNLTSCAQIAEYNDDPFDPDAIARLRIGAYEKVIVMKYIDNLLDWGDFEFTQYSWESITTARMLYNYAGDLLGPQPVDLGPCAASFPVSFADIAARYQGGDIPQFLIDMEHLSSTGSVTPAAGKAGKAYNDLGYYFCIPENDQLDAYWDRIADRLYKIRHCLNINGVAQPLPLFQPPINPMDLVRASAQGGSVLNLLNQQTQNVSNYRFTYLIDKAKAYTAMVSDFGSALLSALEKSDAEALALLNLNQSKIIQNMTLTVKNKQLEALQNQMAGTQQSLASAQNRDTFYTNLINAGYNASENSALSYMQSSIEVQELIAGIQGISVVGYLAPCIFGFSDGGMKFGDAINMGAQMLQTEAQILSQKGSSLETVAQFTRRAEDWQLQQQLAQYEISEIQNQLLGFQANIASSQEEIAIQQKTIDQNQDLISFYQGKFTNKDLYQWMIGQVSSVYFQAYQLALNTALIAQMSYQYELDRSDSYIAFGYWDNLHKGLLAAEGLSLSLGQLENAYTENNSRRMEIEKTVSLKTLNPEAFYAFKAGENQGTLLFSLTEELFDRDFPSHYCRRIKSVSVSIPAVVGPYENIHATLTQNTNLVVLTADPAVVDYAIYASAPQHSGTAPAQPKPSAMRQNWVSNQQIALSSGVNDSGLFVLNFDDLRYLPFEGTGAVSTWTLSMPLESNNIDFGSISDIILSVKYTAKEGGVKFGRDVIALYSGSEDQYQNIRITSFDLKQAFGSAWYGLFQIPPDASKHQTLQFQVSKNVVLPNLKNVQLDQIVIELKTADNCVVSSNATGLTLQVGTVTVGVDVENNRGTVSPSDIAKLTQWNGLDWSLIFSTDSLSILCTNSQLDPAKLLDALLFIVYTSSM